jgi:putative flippase GtrA
MTSAIQADSKPAGLVGWVRQFGVFIGVGLVCATVDVGFMHWLIGTGVSPLVSASWGFAIGLLLNFLLHSRMTFKTSASWGRLGRFLVVVGLNYLLTLGCVGMSTWWMESPLTGKLVSLPLVAINGFLLSRFWIFK